MSPRATLAYGSRPIEIELPEGSVVVEPPVSPPAPPIEELLELALDAPIEAEPLEKSVRASDRVLVIVSDHTRADPRGPLLEAVRKRLPRAASLVVAVANGTHFPSGVRDLGLPSWVDQVLDHDGRDPGQLVEIGRSRRGTPYRLSRAAVEADWIIATGTIRPHYFAGFGAGIKALFPGLGENEAVRINHRLKLDPTSRPGVFEGNACRDDLEEILDVFEPRCFLLNTIEAADKRHVGAVAGHIVHAFRAGARGCAPLYRVEVPASDRVLLSDASPIADSLYQATKMVAMAAPIVRPGATVVIAAECSHGTGPVEVVNQAIYEIGVRPRLPPGTEIRLVSDMTREQVAPTYCRWFPSVTEALDGPALVIPRAAGSMLFATGTD